jgi:hypothetical protein
MNVKPLQLRKLIDESRRHWLAQYSLLEQYEAVVYAHPAMKYVPGTQIAMKQDLERLRILLSKNSARARQVTNKLEEVLAVDEAANGWKGEDRFVEMRL